MSIFNKRTSKKSQDTPLSRLTRAEQHYSLQVGIFIAVSVQTCHAVTEFLELPNMLHHLLHPVPRKLV